LSAKFFSSDTANGSIIEEELYVNQRLEGLIKRAYKQTGKKVVVLIDEYDALEITVNGTGKQ